MAAAPWKEMKLHPSRISVRVLAERNQQIAQSISKLSAGSSPAILRPSFQRTWSSEVASPATPRLLVLDGPDFHIPEAESLDVDHQMSFIRQAIVEESEQALAAQGRLLAGSDLEHFALSVYA